MQALESYNLPDPDTILQQTTKASKIDSSRNFSFDTKWAPLKGRPPICSTFSKAPSKPIKNGPNHSPNHATQMYNNENRYNDNQEFDSQDVLEHQMDELLSIGIKPWDDGAWATLNELYDY